MSHHMTECVTISHKKVASHITSQDLSHMIWLEVQDTKYIDQVDYV